MERVCFDISMGKKQQSEHIAKKSVPKPAQLQLFGSAQSGGLSHICSGIKLIQYMFDARKPFKSANPVKG